MHRRRSPRMTQHDLAESDTKSTEVINIKKKNIEIARSVALNSD